MVKIRLRRLGAHKRPFYRVVVADSRTKRDGPFIEILGTYDPLKEPSEIKINLEKARH
ncbi:MAG: 30S ribosomal protein S16, partial [Thermodesulfovibrionales bacterium]|nr:30S ribosomal protein S16 [Thermodesulfovibrionales bacterium]